MGMEFDLPWWFVLFFVAYWLATLFVTSIVPVLLSVLVARVALRWTGIALPITRWRMPDVVRWTAFVPMVLSVLMFSEGASMIHTWVGSLLILAFIFLIPWPTMLGDGDRV